MSLPNTNTPSILIAPCGMNCGICMAYLRKRNKCVGCNIESPQRAKHCSVCKIKNCTERPEGSQFCFECTKYPCARLKYMDKRYQTNYAMSVIENLNGIRDFGLDRFIEVENTRWVCPHCGNPICVHNGKCYHCDNVA